MTRFETIFRAVVRTESEWYFDLCFPIVLLFQFRDLLGEVGVLLLEAGDLRRFKNRKLRVKIGVFRPQKWIFDGF